VREYNIIEFSIGRGESSGAVATGILAESCSEALDLWLVTQAPEIREIAPNLAESVAWGRRYYAASVRTIAEDAARARELQS